MWKYVLPAIVLFFVACWCNLIRPPAETVTFNPLPAGSTTDPCCGYPCENRGECMKDLSSSKGFTCDCAPGWSGVHCEQGTWSAWFTKTLGDPEKAELMRGSNVMLVVNHIKPLARFVLHTIVSTLLDEGIAPPRWTTQHDYRTWETFSNQSYYSRLLPPVPLGCPTASGTVGPAASELPSPESIVDTFLKRKKFVPCPMGTSVLLAVYAQHFTHQFFRTLPDPSDAGLTDTHHYIDMSQIYGLDNATQYLLRAHVGGRMLTQIVDGQELPPLISKAPVKMDYNLAERMVGKPVPKNEQFALGHPFFGVFPGLIALSTIWLREHNRVAALLAADHPDWDDERLFQVTRMIIIVTCARITVNDYVGENLAKGKFKFFLDPTLMHGSPGHQYQNRISVEFNHLYHWHPFIPDAFRIGNDTYTEKGVMWNSSMVLHYGVETLLDSFSRERAGQASGPSFGWSGEGVAKAVIRHGRALRFQPLNQYRKTVNLPVYTSFEEMTSDKTAQAALKKVYKHVDAVEFFTGLFVENRREGGLFGSTVSNRGVPSTFQGVFGHPLFNPKWWKPATYGGKVGWDLVNVDHDTLELLIHRNSKSKPNGRLPRGQMRVPFDENGNPIDSRTPDTEPKLDWDKKHTDL